MDILERLTTQANQVEVVEMMSEHTKVGFEANRLKSSQVEETKGIAVRVVKDGRLGFSASSDVSAGEKLVANVLESAAFGDEVPLVFPGPQSPPEVVTFDPAMSELQISRLIEIGQEIIDIILRVEPEARVNVELDRGRQRLSLQNQAGAEVTSERSPLSISCQISRVEGDDVLMLFELMGTTVLEGDLLAFAHRAADKLKLAQKGATLRSGRMPVLFSPTGTLVLGYPLMLGLDGKSVYTRTSPMAGKIGEKLFDEKITVVDDPTLDGRFSSAAYDDEGMPHRRNVLVDRGVLKGYLYDLKTAAQSSVESTGNGSRSLFSPPVPSPTNLILKAGETPVAEMIRDIHEGLLVDTALGLGQGNVISGAFSNTLGLAYKIERGEIVGRVKDVSISGNVYDLLQDVPAVSRETEWIYHDLCLPYVFLPEMNVVAKE
jgi:PmbA protein